MGTRLQTCDMALPVGSLNAYIRRVNQVPMLSAEEELSLAKRLYYDGDLDAARALVMSHLRFVVKIARGYLGYGLSHADLIQEGSVGLMKAVKRFNPEMGVRLASFAVHWIKAEIHEFILRNWRIVKVATTKAQRKLFFNLRKAAKRLGWFTQAEIEDVAATLNVSTKEVRTMEARLNAMDAAFDGAIDSDNAPSAPVHYLEDQTHNPARVLEQQDWSGARQKALQQALTGLDERSIDILNARWLSDKKATLHTLAAKHGVSAERIRQLEMNALKNLKKAMDA